MSEYIENVRKYAPDADEGAVNTIVKYLGIALQNRDSSLVSCSDPDELARVRDRYCKKKLGLEMTVADDAIKATCEKMSQERNKHRVTFYYLVAEHSGTLSKL